MPILLDTGPSEAGWHKVEVFSRCEFLYALHKIINVPFPPSDALVRGSLAHVVGGHHYARLRQEQKGKDPGLYYTPQEALYLAGEKLSDEWKSDLPRSKAFDLKALPEMYAAHWFDVDKKFEVLHVEEPFRADVDGHLFTARIDLILRHKDTGRVTVMDHKTAARIDARTVDRYSLSGQFMGLTLFGQKLFGDKFEGTCINFIQGDEPPFKFDRKVPHPAPSQLAAFKRNYVFRQKQLAERIASGLDPWEWPRAMSDLICVHSYGRCDAYDLCQWGSSQLAVRAMTGGKLSITVGSGVKPSAPSP